MAQQADCPMCKANHPGNHGGYHRDEGKPKPPGVKTVAPKQGKASGSFPGDVIPYMKGKNVK